MISSKISEYFVKIILIYTLIMNFTLEQTRSAETDFNGNFLISSQTENKKYSPNEDYLVDTYDFLDQREKCSI